MTNRLYYNDPHQQAFEASVTTVAEVAGRVQVTLDRTAFYPTSGGQPSDRGRLGPWPVVDVVDLDDGDIAHLIESTDAASVHVGQAVTGVIDWARRFDHMQQHTGQHMLSAAFDRLMQVRTVSFHLGSDRSTIDLAREVTVGEIAGAEVEANRIVWENRPVSIRYATAGEAATLSLRKETIRGGTLRLIEIPDFDLSACGGTHVGQTGAVGMVVATAWERFKGGTRLEFLCGGRALRGFRDMREVVASASRLLSVAPADVPAAVERLQDESREQRRVGGVLNAELIGLRADRLAADAEVVTRGRLVLAAVNADANGLKALASALVVLAIGVWYATPITDDVEVPLEPVYRDGEDSTAGGQGLHLAVEQNGSTLSFSWSEVPGADQYRLRIFTESGDPVLEQQVQGTSIELSAATWQDTAAPGKFYGQVIALDELRQVIVQSGFEPL